MHEKMGEGNVTKVDCHGLPNKVKSDILYLAEISIFVNTVGDLQSPDTTTPYFMCLGTVIHGNRVRRNLRMILDLDNGCFKHKGRSMDFINSKEMINKSRESISSFVNGRKEQHEA